MDACLDGGSAVHEPEKQGARHSHALQPLPFPRKSPKAPSMNLRLHLKVTAVALALSFGAAEAVAQGCTNATLYPSNTIAPDAMGGVTQISTCNYMQEYSAIGPVMANGNYEFTLSGGGYITVREGTSTGPVIAEGISPVTATATTAGTLYAHWNTDVNCGTATGCEVTTVQFMLDCTPPAATVTATDDCPNNQFSLNVNVTSIGDGTDVDLVYNVNGGTDQTLAGQQVGTVTLGPFTVGEMINLTVAHSSDPLCNLILTGLQSGNTCPTIIQCGGAPVDQNYCYVNNDNNHWNYQSSTGDALIMIFSAGSIESSSWDHIRIYNGSDNLAPLLYENVSGTTQLAGLQVIAPSGFIYMENSSDGSGSCESGSHTEWVWQVGCLDCTGAAATYTVVTDCDNYEFSVDVNITDIGSGADATITNTGGAAPLTVTAPGVYTVGPFTANTPVTVTVENPDNALCNASSNSLVNPLCPTPVPCGGAPLDEAYCYINNDSHTWHWQSSTGDALIMIFSAGSIESASFDHIRIYNGPDNQSPLVYENTGGATQLAGLQVIAPSGHIYMENSSDGSVSCQSGTYAEWVWQVGCLDCTGASATYTVVTDCDNYEFSVDVDITNIGSGADATINNNAGVAPVTVTAPGVYTVGPFTANTPVVVTIENPDNVLCNTSSNALVNPLCPTPVPCGGAPLDETYCYTNNDNTAWHWQSSTGDALIMIFSAGTIESATYDQLRIYDGPDNLSPLVYVNPTGLTQFGGLQVIAPSGHIYMEISSESSGSCQSSTTYDPWVWQVGCLDCSGAMVTYTVVTDCDNFEFSVEVNITDIGSGADATINNTGGADPVIVTTPGVYTVGPFTANIPVVVSVENPDNVLCNVSSTALVNPLCPTPVLCGGPTLQETYCYINNDSHIWHWESSGGQPLALQFSAGTLESNAFDNLRIYDGPNNLSPLLYQTTLPYPGTDLTGLLVISTGPSIYMENSSDGSVSCQSGGQTPWVWEVGCLDCTNPGATFSIVEDCIHHQFSVAVNVDSLGSGAFARIANSLSTDTMTNVPAGITLVGPFPMDSLVTLTLLNETNNLCRIYSPEFTSNSELCVDTACAATAYEYCYTNLDTAWFAYQGLPGIPLTIEFLWGNLMPDDFVQIYNGWVPTPTPLWQGNLNGNMAGFSINTSNNNDKMLMRIVSNEAYSCATGEAALPLHWVIQCGSVGVSENMGTSFSMFPNPTTGELSLQLPTTARGTVDMRVADLSGRTVHHEIFNSTGGVNTFDMAKLQSGNYVVTITTNDWVKSQQLQIIH